jgi:hypothetical protein
MVVVCVTAMVVVRVTAMVVVRVTAEVIEMRLAGGAVEKTISSAARPPKGIAMLSVSSPW